MSEKRRKKKRKKQLTKPYLIHNTQRLIHQSSIVFLWCTTVWARVLCEIYSRPRNRWMIAMADNLIDIERIKKSCKLSNTLEWFDSLCAMDAHRNIDAKMLLSKFQKIAHTQTPIHSHTNQPTKKSFKNKIKTKTKKPIFFVEIQCVAECIYGLVRSFALPFCLSPCVIFSVLLLIMKMLILYSQL